MYFKDKRNPLVMGTQCPYWKCQLQLQQVGYSLMPPELYKHARDCYIAVSFQRTTIWSTCWWSQACFLSREEFQRNGCLSGSSFHHNCHLCFSKAVFRLPFLPLKSTLKWFYVLSVSWICLFSILSIVWKDSILYCDEVVGLGSQVQIHISVRCSVDDLSQAHL